MLAHGTNCLGSSLTVSLCLNSWWTVSLASCGNRQLASTTCGPSVYLSLCTCCLSLGLVQSLVSVSPATFSPAVCQDFLSDLQKKKLFSPPLFTPPNLSSPAPCLFLFLAKWWLRQSVGAASTQGVNCLSSRIARDGRDPHLFGVGMWVYVYVYVYLSLCACVKT